LTIAGKLTDIHLNVQPGELVAIVGSRGSGKTTLMRALTGLRPVDGGTITLGGHPAGTAESLARVGAAGEAWGLMERLTVWENLNTFARIWGAPRQRAVELLNRLELGDRLNVRADRLTPGEVARLKLARALVHNPSILLLDEPAGDIDSESASLIAFTVAEEAEGGKAVLVTTFGDTRILQVASRICYLEGGRLAEPAARPVTRAVAGRPVPADAQTGAAATVAAYVTPAPASTGAGTAATAPASTGAGTTATAPASTGAGTTAGAPSNEGAGITAATAANAGAATTAAVANADPVTATAAVAAGAGAAAAPRRPVPHVAARKGDRVLLFRPEEIRYAFARDKAVFIETAEGSCGVSFTLAELEERLADSGFFRSHKAYLVNLAYVREIASWTRDSYSLILKDGEEVPLSKHRAHELRVRLSW